MSTPHHDEQPPDDETRPGIQAATERRIGPYKVVREIGHGGMGVVFLAARADDQYRKRVAIKIIPIGTASPDAIRHFRRERQILASLDHPNIARLLDGGTTEDGRPYLVMEYIEGELITRYCDRHDRSIPDRLRLFQDVCTAVAHAHRNLVVHRDLKPANVLVTADGKPKLLDFGIAAFLNPELSGETAGGTRQALTPEYASPEQVQGGAVTTASDTYSLGVVLYELLTGRSPYRVRTRATAEIYRAVCDQEPERPSTAVSRDEATAHLSAGPSAGEAPGRHRIADPARLRRHLKGDLDTILLKALQKEPEHRYLSVEAFSDDIRRYLAGHPVAARRPTMIYRTRKFVRRNWLAASIAAAAILLVLSAAVTLAIQARRLESERNKSQQIVAFLKDLFNVSTPSRARGNAVTAREMLDEGVKKIETSLVEDPETRADLVSTLGEVYQSLGLYAEAERLTRQSLDLHRKSLGEDHELTQRDVASLAWVLHQTGRSDDAVKMAEPVLAVQKRALGDDHDATLATKRVLATAYTRLGRLTESEPLMLEVVEAESRRLGRDHEETLKSLNNLAVLYAAQDRHSEAVKLDEEVLSHRRRRLGDDHPQTIGSINNLAFRYGQAGRHDDARRLLREALVLGERTLGVYHPTYGTILHSLGEMELTTRQFAAADTHLRGALTVYRLQPGHRHLGLVNYQLAQVSAELSRIDQAFDFLEQARLAGHFQVAKVNLDTDPHLSRLAADPRLQKLQAATAGARQ